VRRLVDRVIDGVISDPRVLTAAADALAQIVLALGLCSVLALVLWFLFWSGHGG
jgi:hypothetical protein